jgi:hypothetical protein
LAAALNLWNVGGTAAQHLLISEFAVTPTPGEFVEVFNATEDTLDLSNYYISDYVRTVDAEGYWRLVDRSLVPFSDEFLVHFPAGTKLPPGAAFVVSLHDDPLFFGVFEVAPDFELIVDASGNLVADGDEIPEMVDPGPEFEGRPYSIPNPTFDSYLSNGEESIIVFFWDGESDLVQDVDYVQWGDGGANVTPNKSGFAVDGPDAGNAPSTYLPDTDAQAQQFIAPAGHDPGFTMTRVDYTEGTERKLGGNGLTGHDETSENFTATWITNAAPSLGTPGAFGPPAIVSVTALAKTELLLEFSRALDPVTAQDPANYEITEIETADGDTVERALAVLAASLGAGGDTVTLTTGPQVPVSRYRLIGRNILPDTLIGAILPRAVLFRGFNPGPGIRLDVPKRPFVPGLDGLFEFHYVAPQGQDVLVRVFDLQGRELFVMTEEPAPAGGLATIRWDGRDHLRQRLPAGVYMLHLELPSSGDEITAPIVIGTREGFAP